MDGGMMMQGPGFFPMGHMGGPMNPMMGNMGMMGQAPGDGMMPMGNMGPGNMMMFSGVSFLSWI